MGVLGEGRDPIVDERTDATLKPCRGQVALRDLWHTVPECHVETAMAPYVLPKQFQGIVNRYPWTETLSKNQAMSAEFPCPAAKNVFNLRFPGDYWSLQFTGEKFVELLALTGSPASLIYWLSQNILHTKSCIQKVHCAHCIPWKKNHNYKISTDVRLSPCDCH